MYLKFLKISSGNKNIQVINFRKGINLIVDDSEGQITGNNVGKTTVLKLIDFCFGASPKIIYEDPESKKEVYKLVKDFLVDSKVLITLCVTENLDVHNAKNIILERNFLPRSQKIQKINGKNCNDDEYNTKLVELFFPKHVKTKPTFRQIISHNIRYKDISLNNTLKTLDKYTSDVEYESLYLFLFGCESIEGGDKLHIHKKIKQENIFKKRLEEKQTKSAYEAALSLIENEITILNDKKSNLNINENFESDLNELNNLKYQINILSSEIGRLDIRKNLINEAKNDLCSSISNIDLQQLKIIYDQAKVNLAHLQKTFEDMVQYHNKMATEKIKYITKELPDLLVKIKNKHIKLSDLLKKEAKLSSIISKSDSFGELENLITKLTEQYRNKGEYESIIQQLDKVDKNIAYYNENLKLIDEKLFSDKFEAKVKLQLNKFNQHFAYISDFLYTEKYALKYDKATNKNGQKIYKFSAFNTNMSSGKKQGEISCFDISYTLFADKEDIPCMHFILNDKKELMHDNQLVKISELVNEKNIQFIASILKDKLPAELNNEDYFILKLSEGNKLFNIENIQSDNK